MKYWPKHNYYEIYNVIFTNYWLESWKIWIKQMSNILPYQMKNVGKHCVCRFDAASPGVVFAKTNCNTQEEKFDLLEDSQLPTRAPAAISPPGLSLERQRYLHKNIHPFVKDCWRDVLCPCPPESEDAPVAGPSTVPDNVADLASLRHRLPRPVLWGREAGVVLGGGKAVPDCNFVLVAFTLKCCHSNIKKTWQIRLVVCVCSDHVAKFAI